MSTREILTLQFGHYSNHIGAHYWNIQELSFDYTGTQKNECNHDILYREGQNSKGEVTYTPRLLLSDLKGSLKSLPVSGGLPDDALQEEVKWKAVEKIEQSVEDKNEYLTDIDTKPINEVATKHYGLENSINTWTDYLYPRLHPRTINVVKEYQHGAEKECFDVFHTGQSIWKQEYGDAFSDKIRNYVEECDSMQGFQVNFDCTDGFAGLALGSIEHLADEYSKPILAYPIIASHYADNNPLTPEQREISNLKDTFRLVNLAFSVEQLSQIATFFVPLCTGEKGWRKPGNAIKFDFLNYNPELYYHTAAILASAMDTLNQKYRHKNNFYTLSDVCTDMTGFGRKMAAASLRLPLALKQSEYLIEFLDQNENALCTSITPSCKIASDKLFQLITVRGIEESCLKAPMRAGEKQMNLAAYKCSNVKEMFELYFQAHNLLSATNVTICNNPLQTKTPYPSIFSEKLNKYGFVSDENNLTKIESCPVIAGYHSGNFLSHTLEKLHREVSRIKFAKLHKFRAEGCEAEEFKECLERLSEFKDNYDDDFEL
ncbi:protein misato [Battus philenor]|uniref:protein misato n=1 Tax=Battus philenor TaxID=42288 RepID=UPI0035D0946C